MTDGKHLDAPTLAVRDGEASERATGRRLSRPTVRTGAEARLHRHNVQSPVRHEEGVVATKESRKGVYGGQVVGEGHGDPALLLLVKVAE